MEDFNLVPCNATLEPLPFLVITILLTPPAPTYDYCKLDAPWAGSQRILKLAL